MNLISSVQNRKGAKAQRNHVAAGADSGRARRARLQATARDGHGKKTPVFLCVIFASSRLCGSQVRFPG